MDETLADLKEDYARLHSLYASAHDRAEAFCTHLSSARGSYMLPTKTYLQSQADGLRTTLHSISSELERVRADNGLWSAQHVPELIQKKKEFGDVLRTLHATLGSLLSAGNWQSPSIWHATTPQAGDETGKITVSANDYKRDMHKDEKEYGERFVKEYIDHPFRFAPRAFPTSSGMSAVATVLAHLQPHMTSDDVVFVGRSSYFQNKWQLEHMFPGRVHYIDEFDTEGILAAAAERKPAIVFIDSLCGSESLAIPNLPVLISKLSDILPAHSTLVLDNTVLSTSYQPLRDLPLKPLGGMGLIVVESLLKFHQFGFDRVSGGIIWTPLSLERTLFETRMHMGTMMPDASVHAMPRPDRALFDARLARIGRNAGLLAKKLHALVDDKERVIAHIVHPSLPTYKGYEWTKDFAFQGPFVTLHFKEGTQDVAHYDAFVARVQKAAQKAGVDIVGGTSFGFDTTRLYVTARYATNITKPFVRISVGTETRSEIETLARVFAEVLSS